MHTAVIGLLGLGFLSCVPAPICGAPVSRATDGRPLNSKFVNEARVDLAGKGHLNHVRFRIIGDPEQSGKFTLSVDQATLTDSLDVNLMGFSVLDLDAADRLKEIGVFAQGPSEDFAWAIYFYDGQAIHRVARIDGNVIPTGNGTMVASIRGPGPLTWFYQQKYVLAKGHKLVRVPQEFYPVIERMTAEDAEGHPFGTVRQPFPILRTRTGSDVVVRPRKGSKLTVMLWDGSKWYGVMTHTGLFGWITESALGQNVEGLPAAD